MVTFLKDITDHQNKEELSKANAFLKINIQKLNFKIYQKTD